MTVSSPVLASVFYAIGPSLPQCQVTNSIKVKIKEQHNVILYFLSFLKR